MELQDTKVAYDPPVEESSDLSRVSVINSVKNWINDFF
jgi:hypothetical protein